MRPDDIDELLSAFSEWMDAEADLKKCNENGLGIENGGHLIYVKYDRISQAKADINSSLNRIIDARIGKQS